jgi:hypothetical protein
MVADIPPLAGEFGREVKDVTEASNENKLRPVPTDPPTVT